MDCQIANLTIALRHDDDDDDKVVLLWTEIVKGSRDAAQGWYKTRQSNRTAPKRASGMGTFDF